MLHWKGLQIDVFRIKRPAARESLKAMEPPAVSRFLTGGQYSEEKANINKILKDDESIFRGAPPPPHDLEKRLQGIENKGRGLKK